MYKIIHCPHFYISRCTQPNSGIRSRRISAADNLANEKVRRSDEKTSLLRFCVPCHSLTATPHHIELKMLTHANPSPRSPGILRHFQFTTLLDLSERIVSRIDQISLRSRGSSAMPTTQSLLNTCREKQRRTYFRLAKTPIRAS